jgi:hypothetical protein
LTAAVDQTVKKKKNTVLHGFSCRFHFLSLFSHLALSGMGSTSGHEITHLITVILDGPASYHARSQNMIVFLKGRQLWHYVIGDIPKLVPGLVTDSDSSDGDSMADAVIQVDIFRHVLRNGKASNAGSFPGSLTPLCLPLAVSFLDWKQVK